MAGITLGFLKFVLGFDSLAFQEGATHADKQMRDMQRRFQATADRISTFGQQATVALTLPIAAIATAAVRGAQQQAAAMAQVEAALASMGPVAGRTGDQLAAAADQMEMNSLFDAEVILQQVTANLLTFGNVAEEQFDRAQQSAIDMATRLGNDPQAAAMMLGKALNDPIRGIASLTRVGVQFTEAQRAQIRAMAEAGDVAGAQGVILAEVERQFAGAAKAAADTQPWRQAEVAIGQAMDKIGEAILPIIPPIANAIATMARAFGSLSPEMQQVVIIGGAVAAVIGPIAIAIGATVSAVGAMLPLFAGMAAGFGAIGAAAAAATPFIGALTLAALPWIAAAAGVVAAGVAIYNHWDDLKDIFATVADAAQAGFGRLTGYLESMKDTMVDVARFIFAVITGDFRSAFAAGNSIVERTFGLLPGQVSGYFQAMVSGIRTWVVDRLNAVWDWVIGRIDRVRQAFFDLYDAVVGNSYVPDMVDEIGETMRRLDGDLVLPAEQATERAASAFQALDREVSAIMDRLFPDRARTNQFISDMERLQAAFDGGRISKAEFEESRARLLEELQGGRVTGAAQMARDMDLTIPEVRIDVPEGEEIGGDLMREWGYVADNMEAQNVRIVESFAQLAQGALNEIDRLVKGIRSGNVVDVLSGLFGALDKIGGMVGGFNLGPFKFGGARAMGGPVSAGKSYLVGERGPEMVTFGRSGMVTPNHRLGGGGVTVNVDARDAVLASTVRGWVEEGVRVATAQGAALGSQLGQSAMIRQQSRVPA